LATIENKLQQQKRIYERYQELIKDDLIAQHQFDLAKDEYDYLLRAKDLTTESQKNELEFREAQVEALETSLRRMQDNLSIVKEKQENLTIRAPISGHLTALDAEIGQSKIAGQRLGQIDVMDAFKVRVPVDEHYLARVQAGRGGTFDFANSTYNLNVRRVFLEVIDGRFEIDMEFLGEVPTGIRRGMTLHIRLEMGDISQEAILLAKGGFFQTTGGNWVYVLDDSEKLATKRPIKLGMSNAYVHEVLDGLNPGEKVITSSYESFGNHERLLLK